MPSVKVNDISVYYETHGEGEAMVLLLALGSDISQYRTLITELSKYYQLFVMDNRGAGRTDRPKTRYSIEMMAEDTLALMDALRLPQVNLLGISMGGQISLSLALDHPERVKRLILASTFASRQNAISSSIFRTVSLLGWMPILRNKHPHEYPQPRYAFVRQFQAVTEFDRSRRLKEISMPTLILHAKKDELVSLQLARSMAEGISGAKIVIFNGGHAFMLADEQQEFVREVTSFVGQTGQATRRENMSS
jgi:3-oxoadipate enol-lactonase